MPWRAAQTLWIPGPLPAFNDILRACGGKKRGYTAMKNRWVNDIHMRARAARLRPMVSVRIEFRWAEEHRRRDPDNVAAAKKFVLDGLVAAGVLPDDGWDHVLSWSDTWEVVAARPGVAVALYEMVG